MGGMLSASCIECDEVMTEPMCPNCLQQRMQMMVSEYDGEIAELLQPSALEATEGIICLFCRKTMNRCAHCVSKDIYLFLEEKNPELADEFMGRFDFDLRRTFA